MQPDLNFQHCFFVIIVHLFFCLFSICSLCFVLVLPCVVLLESYKLFCECYYTKILIAFLTLPWQSAFFYRYLENTLLSAENALSIFSLFDFKLKNSVTVYIKRCLYMYQQSVIIANVLIGAGIWRYVPDHQYIIWPLALWLLQT